MCEQPIFMANKEKCNIKVGGIQNILYLCSAF